MLTRVSYAAPAQSLEGKQVRMLTYADACFICGHLPTHADVCWRMQWSQLSWSQRLAACRVAEEAAKEAVQQLEPAMLAQVCADVCRRMPTYADVC